MYDFFLQIDLASVNRCKHFDEKGVAEDEDICREALSPSFINTHLGATMAGNDSPTKENMLSVKKFLRKQALEELAKARPVATVFFRFSHRDDKNKFLLV